MKASKLLLPTIVPEETWLTKPLDFLLPLSENEALAELKAIAKKNWTLKSFIGMNLATH